MKITAEIGTISHGTLRAQDLLTSFASALNGLVERLPDDAASDRLAAMCDEARQLAADMDAFADDFDDNTADRASDLLNDLSYELNNFCPEGCYFGAHEGDGSDFGYWPHDSE